MEVLSIYYIDLKEVVVCKSLFLNKLLLRTLIFLDTNILGNAVLMDACRRYGIKRYHQVYTDEVYGDIFLDRSDLFFTEETSIHISSPYSSSKVVADLFVIAYHRTYGVPVTIVCFSNNYCPYHFL